MAHAMAGPAHRAPMPLMMASVTVLVLIVLQSLPLGAIDVVRHANGPAIHDSHHFGLWSIGDTTWGDRAHEPGVALIQVAGPLMAAALVAAVLGLGLIARHRLVLGGAIHAGIALTILGASGMLTWGALRYGDTFDAAGSGIRIEGTMSPSFGLLLLFGSFACSATTALAAFAAGTPVRPTPVHIPRRQRLPAPPSRVVRAAAVALVAEKER